MAASINFTKISSVVRVTSTVQGSVPSKSYFGAVGKFNNNGNTFYISIGSDQYQEQLGDFQVNGQTPSTISEALTLLTSIFGS